MMFEVSDKTFRRASSARIPGCLRVAVVSLVVGLMAMVGRADEAPRTETRNMGEVLQREVRRSEPDYIGYLPRSWDG